MKTFNFKEQLAIGAKGEAFILGAHPEYRFPRSGTKRWDLERVEVDGDQESLITLELKTDTYPHEETPNFFIERSTNIRKGNRHLLGGPWRSLSHGVKEFVYLYSNGGTKAAPGDPIAYWFRDLPALVARLDANKYPTRSVRSVAVSALGYLVPRSALVDLAECILYHAGGAR